jgi:hypothetical protein
MFLLYNLVFGLAIEGIDMAAHAGGLVAGFVCGAILSQPLDRVNRVTRSIRNVLTLAVGSAGIAAAILAAPSPPGDIRAELDRVSKVEKEVEEIYQDAVRANRAGTLSDEQLLEILEARVLRPWQDVREAFGRMETTRLPATQRRLVAKLQKEIQAREDDWRARVAALREHIGAKRKALQRGNVDPVD